MIEKIVGLLEDGDWHTFKEIKERFDLSEAKLREILEFLEEFGFLKMDEKGKKAKLDPAFLQLPV